MNRKHFIKNIGTLGIGTPFMLNGISAFASNKYLNLSLDCNEVNNRVLVIIRLAGANDGLNTVIPIAQYNTYAALRPTIKINQTGPNAYLALDNTVSDAKKVGFHPALSPLKALYDSGKLTLINGVGYPSPNYSHFAGENLMFAARDGNTSSNAFEGIIGKYISKVYPGVAAGPTANSPDPLAVQLGNPNDLLLNNHTVNNNIGYNVTPFQDLLFTQLGSVAQSVAATEYEDLLIYIKSVESAMDIYYNRFMNVFNAGSNASTYPNTYLAKQLKTIARVIKGGSKTKIFEVNLGSFDTHVNQIQSGSSHLGNHANLLSQFANAVAAFQNDLQAMGLANRVTSVTFSEFGRQVRENGGLGTDHGDISPFFVIGNAVQPGILGDHPTFTNSTSFYYDQSQRKYDYRQLFSTLIQDWLGGNNDVLQATDLLPFAKIPLINAASNASTGGCLTSTIESCETTITAIPLTSSAGWTYYGATGTTEPLFAIEHTPVGGNSSVFTANIILKKLCNTTGNTFSILDFINRNGIIAAGYYWNIQLLTGTLNGFVNIRFFPSAPHIQEIETNATIFKNQSGALYKSTPLYFQTKMPLNLPAAIRGDGRGLEPGFLPLIVSSSGSFSGKDYVQFNGLANIHNNGGGVLCSITNVNQTNIILNLQLRGALRYNPLLNRFEGHNGVEWVPLH